jgi:hypothetical protein
MGDDRDYLEAKFGGLEKLMEAQNQNMKDYVGAVSKSVSEVRKDLKEHEVNTEAHGADLTDRKGNGIIAWLGLLISAGAALLAFSQKK